MSRKVDLGSYEKILDKSVPMKREEEFEWFEKHHSSKNEKEKERIREKIIRSNLRWVVKVALKINPNFIEELIGAGNYGLVKAFGKFDYKRGFRFYSFATEFMKNEMLTFLENDSRVVRRPSNVVRDLRKVYKAFESVEGEMLNQEIENVLSEKTDFSAQKIEDLLHDMGAKEISLDQPSKKGKRNDGSLVNKYQFIPDQSTLKPDQDVMQESMKIDVNLDLNFVTNKRDKEIFETIFGLNGRVQKNMKQISEEMGMTRENVRVIKVKIMRVLQKRKNNLRLKKYLE
jgi:RNA polymerase primary sigma factor